MIYLTKGHLLSQDFCIEAREKWEVLFAAISKLESSINASSAPGTQDCAASAFSDMDQLFGGGDEVSDATNALAGGVAAGISATGTSSGASQGLSGSRPASSNPLAALTVLSAIQHLKAALTEDTAGTDGLFEKLLTGLDEVCSCSVIL